MTRLFDLLDHQQKNHPSEQSINVRDDSGEWIPYSSRQVQTMAEQAAAGLLKLGLKSGDKVALVSYRNRPEWLIMDVLKGGIVENVYPAAGHSEIVLAYMMEQLGGRMSKAQEVGRFRCVVEPFEAADINALGVPVLIIEADNDPLVELALRVQLKETYPGAAVETLHNVGHFPYLNEAETYTAILERFFSKTQ